MENKIETPLSEPIVSSRQELWAQLAAPQDQEVFYWAWLKLLASMGSGNFVRLLLSGVSGDGEVRPLACWPEGEAAKTILIEVAEQAIQEKCGLVHEIEGQNALANFAVAYPVYIGEIPRYVIAAEVAVADEEILAGCMEQIQWGSAWLEAISRRAVSSDNHWRLERMTKAIDLFAQVLDETTFDTAAMTMVTELAQQMDCERASFGLLKGKYIVVRALSHSAQFGEHMNLIRAIGAAMDEAVMQNRLLQYPEPAEAPRHLICREHQGLAEDFGAKHLLTIPLFNGTVYYGAITLERFSDTPFSQKEAEISRDLAALAGAVLHKEWLNARPLLLKVSDALTEQLKRLFGPHYLTRKLVMTAGLGLIIFFSLFNWDYRLSADTVLEGAVRRMVVAPYDGFIAESLARAGDIVEDGAVLCRLDDRDLLLERLNWTSQRSQLQKQRQEAFAARDRAKVNIITAKLAQAAAQLELIENKLSRTRLSSPYHGQVISGDLTQRLGGVVQQGEVLFEIAPLDAYRLILKVDERRIADLQVGQTGELVLTSLPQRNFAFAVSKLTPITTTGEGRNFFRVEAQLVSNHDSLRPGMEGVGKVMIDRRNLLGIWTREMREWLTLWLWSWCP